MGHIHVGILDWECMACCFTSHLSYILAIFSLCIICSVPSPFHHPHVSTYYRNTEIVRLVQQKSHNIMLLWIAGVWKLPFHVHLQVGIQIGERKRMSQVLESMLCSTAEWKTHFAESKLPPLMKSYRGSESN